MTPSRPAKGTWLWQIIAPDFVAGFEAINGRIVRHAPILKRFVQFRSEAEAVKFLTVQCGFLAKGKLCGPDPV